jgi:hypothetical protein
MIEEAQALIKQKRDALIAQAAKVIDQNQECYVAQWILHNPDENPKDWVLAIKQFGPDEGFGYNFLMVPRGDIQ